MVVNRFFIVNLLILISESIQLSQTSNITAIVFLTWRPSTVTIDFAQQLSDRTQSIDVYIVVDDNNFQVSQWNSTSLQFLQLKQDVLLESGFYGANIIGSLKNVTAWEKAIFYFCRQAKQYQFVWFVEEDVFIPSTQAFTALHDLYAFSNDLVVSRIDLIINGNTRTWYHAPKMRKEFPLPWLFGMVCAIGVSRHLLTEVNRFVLCRGHLSFIEFFFHMLVFRNGNMSIVTPVELSNIVYRHQYNQEQIEARPNHWWHPLKNYSTHHTWRNK